MSEVVLPWPPRELSPNARVHWSKKAKAAKRYKLACWALAKEAKAAVDWDGPVHLWITFHTPSRRTNDVDNCVAAIKSGLDGLALALGINDSRFVLHPWISSSIAGSVVVRLSIGLELAGGVS